MGEFQLITGLISSIPKTIGEGGTILLSMIRH